MNAPAAPPVRRESWATPDLGEAFDLLRTEYGASLRMRESRTKARALSVDRRQTSAFECHDVRLPAQLQFDVEDYGAVVIAELQAGTVTANSDAHGVSYRRGDVFMSNFPGAHYRCHCDHALSHTVTIPVRVLAQSAGVAPSSLRFMSGNPVSTAAAELWVNTLTSVERLLADPVTANPIVLGKAARMLATRVLEIFPMTRTPGTEHPGRLVPNFLRRAIGYMEENADGDIGVADIAAAVELTPDGVTYLFRRHLGVAPLEHLRRIRLDRAHRELLDQAPESTTVFAIAARWGFVDLAAFEEQYYGSYGQSPQVTLQAG
ncbi:helix-turn-helix domain-containing protein [Mycobacterium sp. GA-2829]|uniref:helix-turn-helix domain-containing protein n=1 Tax=Mycobacterium sp. GA-2829 TaxID=1772283 RepID=UPI0007400E3B|nr:helix-turn-helix domain-containing protein [Mycobacterium sp. GA-2829]KUI32716.1 AraC family transcriptional regulator [Mycobacterium sp. GA-2829]